MTSVESKILADFITAFFFYYISWKFEWGSHGKKLGEDSFEEVKQHKGIAYISEPIRNIKHFKSCIVYIIILRPRLFWLILTYLCGFVQPVDMQTGLKPLIGLFVILPTYVHVYVCPHAFPFDK